MKNPFKIFPSIGYKNSQFQVVSKFDDLKIDLFLEGNLEKSVLTYSTNVQIIQKLEKPGNYRAECIYNDQVFEQNFEVKDALRFGSSDFKNAFLFEDSKYSFFLMKDRLLLYDEEKESLLTENHYSPSNILKIDKTYYLFLTEIGSSEKGIVNFAIYNTETFSIVGELVDCFQHIHISTSNNVVWLLNKLTNSIHCYRLIGKADDYFAEVHNLSKYKAYNINLDIDRLIIEFDDKVIFINLNDPNESTSINKMKNNAIDKFGNNIIYNNLDIEIENYLDDYYFKTTLNEDLYLDLSEYIYVGTTLFSKQQFGDLSNFCDNIKKDIIGTIPENKSYFSYTFQENEVIQEELIHHYLFPTINGLFLLYQKSIRKFNGVRLRKNDDDWVASPRTIINFSHEIYFLSEQSEQLINSSNSYFSIKQYNYSNKSLLLNSNTSKLFYIGNYSKSLSFNSSLSFYNISGNNYFLVMNENLFTLYDSSSLESPLLINIEIYNFDYIKQHGIIWYSGKIKSIQDNNKFRSLCAYDLLKKKLIKIDENRAQHSIYKDASDYDFKEHFILSSNKVVINPYNANIKDAYIGNLETYSASLNKILSHRTNYIYLSLFDDNIKKYVKREIKLDIKKLSESYLSPDGNFLVLQEDSNKYSYYDIRIDDVVHFFSGNFLAFSQEGNLIIEEDKSRAVKIYDPITFSDITPPNYHHYRFLSPDGKLYAQVSLKIRYFNKLTGDELSKDEAHKICFDLDDIYLSFCDNQDEYNKKKNIIDKNRLNVYLRYQSKFNDQDIKDHSLIRSDNVLIEEKFTEIGVVGTDISTEIIFPKDLQYYNYSAFSYDNKYFGYVGKPNVNGLIHLIKLHFDESNNILSVLDSYTSRHPRWASWVCGFSKTGYFATYDSNPNTYIIKMNEHLFKNKTDDTELKENIYYTKSNIYHSYHNWNEIKGKNFLCFSPSGKYLALSEQGYEPLTLGGYGHQESNVVHIATTETGEIVDSFTGHGDKIRENRTKKVTFVAFSEDENKIMTLSSDGVLIIRNIDIKDRVLEEEVEENKMIL